MSFFVNVLEKNGSFCPQCSLCGLPPGLPWETHQLSPELLIYLHHIPWLSEYTISKTYGHLIRTQNNPWTCCVLQANYYLNYNGEVFLKDLCSYGFVNRKHLNETKLVPVITCTYICLYVETNILVKLIH